MINNAFEFFWQLECNYFVHASILFPKRQNFILKFCDPYNFLYEYTVCHYLKHKLHNFTYCKSKTNLF